MSTQIEFGKTYRDKITGFTGIAIGRCTYMSGCDQALLAPPVDKDGKRRDGEWFDVQRCEDTGVAAVTLDNGKTPGCDRPGPTR